MLAVEASNGGPSEAFKCTGRGGSGRCGGGALDDDPTDTCAAGLGIMLGIMGGGEEGGLLERSGGACNGDGGAFAPPFETDGCGGTGSARGGGAPLEGPCALLNGIGGGAEEGVAEAVGCGGGGAKRCGDGAAGCGAAAAAADAEELEGPADGARAAWSFPRLTNTVFSPLRRKGRMPDAAATAVTAASYGALIEATASGVIPAAVAFSTVSSSATISGILRPSYVVKSFLSETAPSFPLSRYTR